MAGLIEKMNSLPKANTVNIAEIVEGNKEEKDVLRTDSGTEETKQLKSHEDVVEKDPKDEAKTANKEEPKEQPKAATSPDVEEPESTATQERKDAYKQRKIKEADKKAENLQKELDDAKREKDEWKRQAQTVAERSKPAVPRTELEQPKAIDINKDPVGYLAKGLDDVNKRYAAIEHEQTVNAAMSELNELESQSSSKLPDYNEVMKHAEDSEVAKMKLMNPNASEIAIRKGFKNDKVKAAAMFIAQGRDPIESIYNLARVGYGYRPKENVAESKVDKAKEKADAEKARFDAVNKNKSKSATGLSAGGSSGETELRGPSTTKKRTLKEFAQLTKQQKDADYIPE